MKVQFTPHVRTVWRIPGQATIGELANEVGMYSATPVFVLEHGGPITKEILACVPPSFFEEAEHLSLFPNIIVRIHRLYLGDYPAFPGWHCDGEYRKDYFAQPELDKVPPHSHITATISTHAEGVSRTQFLMTPCAALIDEEQPVWTQVHKQVEALRPRDTLDARDGELIEFGSMTLHRAMPARIRGWRLFFRISMWHKPGLGDGGLLSKQEQVYRLAEEGGW